LRIVHNLRRRQLKSKTVSNSHFEVKTCKTFLIPFVEFKSLCHGYLVMSQMCISVLVNKLSGIVRLKTYMQVHIDLENNNSIRRDRTVVGYITNYAISASHH
jgi:hypothetical protein